MSVAIALSATYLYPSCRALLRTPVHIRALGELTYERAVLDVSHWPVESCVLSRGDVR